MTRRELVVLLLLFLTCASAAAAPRVVATTSSMGALVREVGGPQVKVEVLVSPERDAHYQQAKPSMARALRNADLLVAVGAELEVGWLPAAIASAANAKILPGRLGYFEAAAQVPLIETGLPANRALGDIHPMGNPHVNMDPARMATIGRALADRLGQLDPANATDYRERAEAFADRVARDLAQWRTGTARAPGAILYHRDANYLFERLGVPILGYVEPVPGVPPTARHIKQLTDQLTGQRGVIIYAPYHSSRGPATLAKTLGWKTVRLSSEPPLEADGRGYLGHIQRWVDAIVSGKG